MYPHKWPLLTTSLTESVSLSTVFCNSARVEQSSDELCLWSINSCYRFTTKWNSYDCFLNICTKQYKHKLFSGPLTYIDDEGETVLLGVVSQPGNQKKICIGSTIYGRISSPKTLQWIKKNIQDYDWIQQWLHAAILNHLFISDDERILLWNSKHPNLCMLK